MVTLTDSFSWAEQNIAGRLEQVSPEASRSAFNGLLTDTWKPVIQQFPDNCLALRTER